MLTKKSNLFPYHLSKARTQSVVHLMPWMQTTVELLFPFIPFQLPTAHTHTHTCACMQNNTNRCANKLLFANMFCVHLNRFVFVHIFSLAFALVEWVWNCNQITPFALFIAFIALAKTHRSHTDASMSECVLVCVTCYNHVLGSSAVVQKGKRERAGYKCSLNVGAGARAAADGLIYLCACVWSIRWS